MMKLRKKSIKKKTKSTGSTNQTRILGHETRTTQSKANSMLKNMRPG